MEEGSLRCDANISLRPRGAHELGTKVEIKNLNSIRSLHRALQYEQRRQVQALASGEPLIQETRHWDEHAGVTTRGRSKEYAFDYRYFPEPDLSPLEPDAGWVDELRAELPELPAARRRRFRDEYGLDARQTAAIAGDGRWARFFEEAVERGAQPDAAANWLTGDLAGLLNEAKIGLSDSRVTPGHLARLVTLVREGTVSSAGAKVALAEAFETGEDVDAVVERRGLRQVSDAGALEAVVDEVVAENDGLAEQFRSGKDGVINALVGQVMKKTKGSANPGLAQQLLRARLSR
jgi:aspartyl-tRNA(Asn)/glutamyl-tRNA(Gln) amidotransferase subunit B